jgi:predicted nucleic acid-binding protein
VIFLDANVVSDTMRPRPDANVAAWLSTYGGTLQLSTIVIAEICFGISRKTAEERSPRWMPALEGWVSRLQGRIHVFDEASAMIYGEIMGIACRNGRPLDVMDAMIAAIALRHGAALATRNTKHFEGLGIRLINPWEHDARSR